MRKYELIGQAAEGGPRASVVLPAPPSGLSTIAYCPAEGAESPVSDMALTLAKHVELCNDQPVRKVEIFRRDARIKKHAKSSAVPIGGKRGIITQFSDQSMARLLFVVKNCDVDFYSMQTVTYPREFPTDGRAVKAHFKALRQSMLHYFPGVRGVWWMEFQKRGAPHFHVLTDIDLASKADLSHAEMVWRRRKRHASNGYWTFDPLEKWLLSRWYEIVSSGDPAHLVAGCAWEMIESTEGALRYTAAHASKRKQKQVPPDFQNVGRPWGKIGDVDIEKFGEAELTTAEVFEILGPAALSGRGRVKKYLYDAAGRFEYEA